MKHRKEFVGQKLADAFPSTLNYHCQKMFEAVGTSGDATLGGISVDHILKSVEQFKDELEKRDILEAYDITYNLELVDYPLQELKKYFSTPDETHINKRDAYIFACFAEQQIQGLFETAKELDAEYSQ